MDTKESMDQVFIKKVTELLEVNLGSEQFGVKELAHEIGVSRSKLHRKLNRLTGKSTSQFIREYRLDKAMTMLQNDVATVSEIAYLVGFGSPTYFNTCFHDYYGYPPGEAKIREANTEENQLSIQNKASNIQGKITKSKKISSIRSVISASLFGIVLIISISYLIYSDSLRNEINETTKDLIKDKSIGVLPFKNLSDDQSNQYFADGVMHVIINHLSRIEEFQVISRTTMEQYRETVKTSPEIAKELNISYVLEASVQKNEDKVRIFVQLIDAIHDTPIWSDDIERSYEEIFELQSEIAKQVVGALEKKLSPMELEQIEKIPTKNLEAYNFYLKGRHFFHERTMRSEKLKKSLEYFEKSLSLDPSYAMAYAGLADAHLHLATREWGVDPLIGSERITKAKEYVRKALEIDPNLAEAHTVLGYITCFFDWQWEEGGKILEKAIELSPNYSTARLYYSQYLMVTGQSDTARVEINKAIELNPFSMILHGFSGACYYNEQKLDEALIEGLKIKELDNDYYAIYWSNFHIYWEQGKEEKAIQQLKHLWSKDSYLAEHIKFLDDIYSKNGMNGVIKWWMSLVENRIPIHTSYFGNSRFIAMHYGIIGENELAIEYLERAFELGGPTIPSIKYDRMLASIRSDPRFISMLEQMGLVEEKK